MRRLWFVVIPLLLGGAVAWRAVVSSAGRASSAQTEEGALSASALPAASRSRRTYGHRSVFLLGDRSIESSLSPSQPGTAQAVGFTGQVTGAASGVVVYAVRTGRATRLIAGLYADHGGRPGRRLANGSIRSPRGARWNRVPIPSTPVREGVRYWIVVLGVGGGLGLGERAGAGCSSQRAYEPNGPSLPSYWQGGSPRHLCAISAYANGTAAAARPITAGPLPGEVLWPNRVSNLIFGTTDTGEWGTPNVEFTNAQSAPGTPNKAVQHALRKAGFQLDRMFVNHNEFANGKEMSNAEIAARVNTAARIGGQCIITFSSISTSHTRASGDTMTDLEFAEHVARLTDGQHAGYAKCSMFEIGNEPDCGGGPFNNGSYASTWARYVNALRAIRPDAKFIGPVECNGVSEMLSFLREIVANHYPVPDAISWHWYPCGWSSESWSSCPLSVTNQIINDAQTVRNDLQSTIGHQIPIGISEWSADGQPSGTKNMAYSEPSMSHFITASLDAMVKARLDFGAEFDAQSFAAYGGLDMFDSANTPRPYFKAYANEIAKYR